MGTGRGLMVGLDLVTDRASRTPAPALATWLLNRLREKQILMAKEGEHGNVIYILPPIFTFHGMTLAQPEYMQKLFAYVRSLGALVIIDEVQGGLGRYKTDRRCTTSRR